MKVRNISFILHFFLTTKSILIILPMQLYIQCQFNVMYQWFTLIIQYHNAECITKQQWGVFHSRVADFIAGWFSRQTKHSIPIRVVPFSLFLHTNKTFHPHQGVVPFSLFLQTEHSISVKELHPSVCFSRKTEHFIPVRELHPSVCFSKKPEHFISVKELCPSVCFSRQTKHFIPIGVLYPCLFLHQTEHSIPAGVLHPFVLSFRHACPKLEI